VTTNYRRVFGHVKPVIAMVHIGASPGAPLFDSRGGIEGVVESARKDLKALQAAGFDAVMFGNENDRPYELKADVASSATMAYVVGRLRAELATPFGVNVLWDPISTLGVAAATGASFVREIFTGSYASDMGAWTTDAGAALRYRKRLDRCDLALLYNVSAEFAYSLDRRSVADRARSAVFSSIPDAILVSGGMTGEAARTEDLEETKRALPGTPVLANTGVKHATVRDVLAVADGCIVGSALKVDGDTWKPVDPERASEFMRLARAAREG
jgi:membrane complex biogenesis BtpA family protein